MSIPNDLSTLEKMQNMKNMIGDGFIEFLKPNIKSHQNENVLKMLDLAKDKPDSFIELLSVAIFHHNIPIIKHIIEKSNLTETDAPYINAHSFYNSILPDNSNNKLTDGKETYIDVQIPFVLMAGISGHINIFEYLMNNKLIINKKIFGIIGLSRKNKNLFYSNVIGACSFYGKFELLDFILKNYKEELDIDIVTTEKKSKNNKMGLVKEYTGCTPTLLAMVGPADDNDSLEVLKILNYYHAKLEKTNLNNDNILHLATKNNKVQCVKYICEELGLKNLANDINKEGYTPLSLAQHLNYEKLISFFCDINADEQKTIEENLKELLAESANKETKKGKKKKGKKKGKNNNNDNDDIIPGYLASSDYQETLKEIVPKKINDGDNKNKLHELLGETNNKIKGKKEKNEKNNVVDDKREMSEEEPKEESIEEISKKENKNQKNTPTPLPEGDFIIGLSFKNKKKNKKLKLGDNYKHESNTKKETPISNSVKEINSNLNSNQIEKEPEKIQENETNEEIKNVEEKKDEIKKEKKIKGKKTKKEKRKDKETTDDFIEQMRKKEKERQELKRIEEEKKRKEQEEKEKEIKEKEEQERIFREEQEKLRKEQEEKERLEELKRQEELKLKEEEENRKKEEEEEKSEKEILSYTEEENNNIKNINISEENKEEEKEIEVNYEDYERLNKNYLELEKRLSNLEQEKAKLTSCLTKLYLENKSKTEIVTNSNEENINDLMYLANKELSNKNEIINDLENKLIMLDLSNIKNFSVEKLKKYKEFYSKNLQIINDAMK